MANKRIFITKPNGITERPLKKYKNTVIPSLTIFTDLFEELTL